MQEMQEMWVQPLGWEDPLEEEMATHSSILAWRMPWTEEPGGLQSMGQQRVRRHGETKRTLTYCTNGQDVPLYQRPPDQGSHLTLL